MTFAIFLYTYTMSKKSSVSKETQDKIIDLYKNNSWYTIKRLANKFKLSTYRVSKILKDNNVDTYKKQYPEEVVALCMLFLDRESITSQNLRIASELLSKCNDMEFWESMNKPTFGTKTGKMSSLSWFLGEKGRNYLRFQYKMYKSVRGTQKVFDEEEKRYRDPKVDLPQKTENVKLEDKPLIEQQEKPKSFEEFMKEHNHG